MGVYFTTLIFFCRAVANLDEVDAGGGDGVGGVGMERLVDEDAAHHVDYADGDACLVGGHEDAEAVGEDADGGLLPLEGSVPVKLSVRAEVRMRTRTES